MKIKNRLKNNSQERHSGESILNWAHSRWLSLIMIRRLAIFSLLLLTALLCAKIIWLLIPTPDSSAGDRKVSNRETIQTNKKTPSTAIGQLRKLQIFGPTTAENKKAINIKNAIESRLSLVLNGVLASNIEQQSKAIISHNNKQASYQTGDSLPVSDNVTLSQVLADRVIIENRGKYETLWLTRDSKKTSPPAKQPLKGERTKQRPAKKKPSRNLNKRNNTIQSSNNSLGIIIHSAVYFLIIQILRVSRKIISQSYGYPPSKH